MSDEGEGSDEGEAAARPLERSGIISSRGAVDDEAYKAGVEWVRTQRAMEGRSVTCRNA